MNDIHVILNIYYLKFEICKHFFCIDSLYFNMKKKKTDGDQNSASMFIIYNIVMNVIKTTI